MSAVAPVTADGPAPLEQTVHLRTEIPGPKSRALREREDAHIAPGLQGYALLSGIAVDHAVGSAVTDVDGNTFLDFIGGIGVNALGHAHPRVVAAVQRQVARAHVGSFTSQPRVELVERLAGHPPAPGLHRVQLYSGGAEAVESALRLAKSHTKKHEFVSFWGGFHGKTMGALALMGSTYKAGLGPMVAGNYLVPYADCYRCPVRSTYPGCGLACVELGRKHLKMAATDAIAGVVVEPMQGTAGNVVPPDDFLPAVQAVAREFDALLIADEMITGFGRTGRFWGVDHSGARPDVVTIGKAFGGGFPPSGLMTNDTIARAEPWSRPSGSSSSYGGNPLAAAAGAAAVRAIDDEALVENARVVGGAMLAALRPLVDRYPFIGEVRGRGLFIGIDLVRDKKTKDPLSPRATRRLFDECLRRGLLTMAYAPRLRLQPALTIDMSTALDGVAILAEAFDAIAHDGSWEAP
ncbi:MAG: aspartate aminotransferase family protein [Polyangiaceae bacterium]|nr:aspartate aminotransferase family protein [Polyangiaceae bacterium]